MNHQDPTSLLAEGGGKSYLALSHGTPLPVDRVWMWFTPRLTAGWRVALARSI